MLELDEKKIRKGKPLGLPYQGSKKKISKKIVEIIKQNFGTEKPIYDIFGGGGAITAECMLNGLEVHYNDLDETVTRMFQKVVSEDRDYLKTLIVSRDEFFRIRVKENKTVDDNLKLLVNSFGNNKRSYLYSKKLSDSKYNLAVEIIEKYDAFDGYRKTEVYLGAKDIFKDQAYQKTQQDRMDRLQQLQRLQQLEHLQQLGRLQQLQCVEVTNLDYTEFSGLEDAVLYLDPPYQNATLDSYSISEFDNQSFYDWAYEMSKKNIVLTSSYGISDKRFECVYEFKTVKSTFAPNKRGKHTEKLFMVKKGEK